MEYTLKDRNLEQNISIFNHTSKKTLKLVSFELRGHNLLNELVNKRS